MGWETFIAGLSVGGPIVLYIIGYFQMLNTKVNSKMTSQEVKELIELKLDPLKEDLEDIKKRIDKIIDYHLSRNV